MNTARTAAEAQAELVAAKLWEMTTGKDWLAADDDARFEYVLISAGALLALAAEGWSLIPRRPDE